ncbi:hypothetical protein B0H11DRAFT_1916975 [Mycena galericulata]|nr:hypothetical protein B0H11DRAFT_1916975 [Mycena galericulata]
MNPLYIIKPEKAELVGNSLGDLPKTNKTEATYPASLLLSKPNLFEQMVKKFKSLRPHKVEAPDSRMSTLQLYDFKARGWNAITERWMMSIYPRLDSALGTAEDPEGAVWNLQWGNVNTESKGKTARSRGGPITEPKIDEEIHAAHEPDSEAPEVPSRSSLGTTDPSTEGSLPSASTSDTTANTHAAAGIQAGPSDMTKAGPA